MIYCFIAKDVEAENSIRTETLLEHKAYLKSFSQKIAFAGPLLTATDSSLVVGSLFVLELASYSEAKLFIDKEPFNKKGLFKSVEIFPFENRWEQMVGFPVS